MPEEDRALTQAVQQRAAAYLGLSHERRIEVRHIGARARDWSRVDRYRLRSDDLERVILVKRPGMRERRQSPRPRIAPMAAIDTRMDLEYEALQAIASHVASPGDPRIGAVQVLGRVANGGIVMLRADGSSLSRLVATSAGRVRLPRTRQVLTAARNAGIWLRRFAAIQGLAPRGSRLAERDEVVRLLVEFAEHLERLGESPRLMRRISTHGVRTAERLLPARLPLGLGHGDFATRNILVQPGGRVIVIDTRARWCAPIWEDVASLIVSLHANRLQSLLQGAAFPAAHLGALETAFLAGRFDGEEASRQQILLLQLLILLDRWAASRDRASRHLSTRISSGLIRRHYARLAAGWLTRLVRS